MRAIRMLRERTPLVEQVIGDPVSAPGEVLAHRRGGRRPGERRIAGCADHTREELVELMELARTGAIDLSAAITRRVPLEAGAINEVLDELERGTQHVRTVIELP